MLTPRPCSSQQITCLLRHSACRARARSSYSAHAALEPAIESPESKLSARIETENVQANLGITRDGAARASPPFSRGARRPMNRAPQHASPAVSSSASTSSGSGRWISSLRGDSGGRSVSLMVGHPRCAFEVVLRWSMGREHVVRVLDLVMMQHGTWGE